MRNQDLGPDYYQRRAQTRRKIAYHVRELEELGLEVASADLAQPRTTRNTPRLPDPYRPHDPDRPNMVTLRCRAPS